MFDLRDKMVQQQCHKWLLTIIMYLIWRNTVYHISLIVSICCKFLGYLLVIFGPQLKRLCKDYNMIAIDIFMLQNMLYNNTS